MLRTSSNIGVYNTNISAKSTFTENEHYFTKSDILDNMDYFLKSVPYLARQYDESDAILYVMASYDNGKFDLFDALIRVGSEFGILLEYTVFLTILKLTSFAAMKNFSE